MSYNFALIGLAGYIAPRHLHAIKETENELIVALDKSDSVGIIDKYFPDASFFTEFERFDRHIEKLKKNSDLKVHYVSICSPNYLHDAHIRFALRIGEDAICEKPLVLNPWNITHLEELEKETGRNIYNVLQLRLHPTVQKLKNHFTKNKFTKKHEIELTYIAPRGLWYQHSWKGNLEKSGGIATNIGIHFFDMLIWIFGKVIQQEVHFHADGKTAGYIELENANVKWYLSLDSDDLPEEAIENNQTSYRSMMLDGRKIEFSDGFTDLHTLVYLDILEGNGFRISDAKPSVDLAYQIRNTKVTGLSHNSHPMLI